LTLREISQELTAVVAVSHVLCIVHGGVVVLKDDTASDTAGGSGPATDSEKNSSQVCFCDTVLKSKMS